MMIRQRVVSLGRIERGEWEPTQDFSAERLQLRAVLSDGSELVAYAELGLRKRMEILEAALGGEDERATRELNALLCRRTGAAERARTLLRRRLRASGVAA